MNVMEVQKLQGVHNFQMFHSDPVLCQSQIFLCALEAPNHSNFQPGETLLWGRKGTWKNQLAGGGEVIYMITKIIVGKQFQISQ
jgi:hypothetical protein